MSVDRAYCLACCVPIAQCECRPGDGAGLVGLEVTELEVETIEPQYRCPECGNECARVDPELERIIAPGAVVEIPAPQLEAMREERERVLATINGAYSERNQLVALLARLYPSGVAHTPIEGWDPAWLGCVYIDLPNGQASWHFHESEAHLFAGLPAYDKPYDGHTTPQKYQRIAELRDRLQQQTNPQPAGTSEA